MRRHFRWIAYVLFLTLALPVMAFAQWDQTKQKNFDSSASPTQAIVNMAPGVTATPTQSGTVAPAGAQNTASKAGPWQHPFFDRQNPLLAVAGVLIFIWALWSVVKKDRTYNTPVPQDDPRNKMSHR